MARTINRGTYPWADKGGKPDLALLADFRTLIKLRKDHAVLRHGTLDAPAYIDENVIVLVRHLGDVCAMTATNNASTSRSVPVTLPEEMSAEYLLNALIGSRVPVVNRTVIVEIPATIGTARISQ